MSGTNSGIGQLNVLKVSRLSDYGAYLFLEDDEVLLPNKFVPEGLKPDDEIEVFVYTDSEDRLVATTQQPAGVLNDYVALEVVDTAPFGAFLDWGLDKHLLVPNSEMERTMEVGKKYVVRIVLDHRTGRLIGVSKLRAFLKSGEELEEREKVRAMVIGESDLGFSMLIEDRYLGLIYRNEVVEELAIGDYHNCYVKNVREDGKVDLMLRLPGKATIDSDASSILEKLRSHNGELPYNDKSDSEEIHIFFGISKKAFKRAIGSLYKERLINITDNGIQLVAPEL